MQAQQAGEVLTRLCRLPGNRMEDDAVVGLGGGRALLRPADDVDLVACVASAAASRRARESLAASFALSMTTRRLTARDVCGRDP